MLASDKTNLEMKQSFLNWPFFAEDEIQKASAILHSGKVNYWTGDEGKHFEAEFAAYTGTKYAIALANGTVALELALYALGIGPGDEVITTCRTFIASASAIVMRGAMPILADVSLESQNITAETILPLITSRTKAIVVVHLAGMPCDMQRIVSLARAYQLYVIEDCAQAHGARFQGKPIGSFSDIAAFSFCQDKIMTTGGEGGMVTTNDAVLWEKMWSFKDHGKSYQSMFHKTHPPGFRFVHDSFGTNWRLTEVQSAIGRLQLKKLDHWVALRRQNAAILDRYFETIPGLRLIKAPADYYHAYYKYYVFVEPAYFRPGWHRDRLLSAIEAAAVPCYSGICGEIYLEKAFQQETPETRKPNARLLSETSLMFLVHPTLSSEQMHLMGETVCRVMREAFC